MSEQEMDERLVDASCNQALTVGSFEDLVSPTGSSSGLLRDPGTGAGRQYRDGGQFPLNYCPSPLLHP